jgi:hypothetical protein
VTTGNREASELVIARLTEESISAELKIAGLPAVTIVRAAAAYSPGNITLYIIIGNPHICALKCLKFWRRIHPPATNTPHSPPSGAVAALVVIVCLVAVCLHIAQQRRLQEQRIFKSPFYAKPRSFPIKVLQEIAQTVSDTILRATSGDSINVSHHSSDKAGAQLTSQIMLHSSPPTPSPFWEKGEYAMAPESPTSNRNAAGTGIRYISAVVADAGFHTGPGVFQRAEPVIRRTISPLLRPLYRSPSPRELMAQGSPRGAPPQQIDFWRGTPPSPLPGRMADGARDSRRIDVDLGGEPGDPRKEVSSDAHAPTLLPLPKFASQGSFAWGQTSLEPFEPSLHPPVRGLQHARTINFSPPSPVLQRVSTGRPTPGWASSADTRSLVSASLVPLEGLQQFPPSIETSQQQQQQQQQQAVSLHGIQQFPSTQPAQQQPISLNGLQQFPPIWPEGLQHSRGGSPVVRVPSNSTQRASPPIVRVPSNASQKSRREFSL